jgi:hypothetical protein
MRNFILLTIFIISLFFSGCDGGFYIRGLVNNDELNRSYFVSDSLFKTMLTNKGVENVRIQFDPNVLDSLISQNNLEKFNFITTSDSLGYFEYEAVFAPGEYITGIVTSKDGYLNDTIFFNHSDMPVPVNVIINLKKK